MLIGITDAQKKTLIREFGPPFDILLIDRMEMLKDGSIRVVLKDGREFIIDRDGNIVVSNSITQYANILHRVIKSCKNDTSLSEEKIYELDLETYTGSCASNKATFCLENDYYYDEWCDYDPNYIPHATKPVINITVQNCADYKIVTEQYYGTKVGSIGLSYVDSEHTSVRMDTNVYVDEVNGEAVKHSCKNMYDEMCNEELLPAGENPTVFFDETCTYPTKPIVHRTYYLSADRTVTTKDKISIFLETGVTYEDSTLAKIRYDLNKMANADTFSYQCDSDTYYDDYVVNRRKYYHADTCEFLSVEKVTPTCEYSENDIYDASTITGTDISGKLVTISDTCSYGYLIKAYCDSDKILKTRIVDCDLACNKGKCLTELDLKQQCLDEDGGLNFNIKSKSMGLDVNENVFDLNDFCKDSFNLYEGICDANNRPNKIEIKCPLGCGDGRCFNANDIKDQHSCVDTDNDNLYSRGLTYGFYGVPEQFTDVPKIDTCVWTDKLKEYSCDSLETNKGKILSREVFCGNGCKEGACRNSPSTDPDYYYNFEDGKIYHFFLGGPGQSRTLLEENYLYDVTLKSISGNTATIDIGGKPPVPPTIEKGVNQINGLKIFVYDIQPNFIVLKTTGVAYSQSNDDTYATTDFDCGVVNRVTRSCGNHSETIPFTSFVATDNSHTYSKFTEMCVNDGTFDYYYEEWCAWKKNQARLDDDLAKSPCSLPWGGTTPALSSVIAYILPSVNLPTTCVSQTRTCANGTLSSVPQVYMNPSCVEQKQCTLDSVTISSGSSMPSYTSKTVNAPATCPSSVPRTCTNGVLSIPPGYGTFSSCNVLAQCTLDGKTISSGSSYSFFSATSVPFGSNCAGISQSRLCTNGNFDGSTNFKYSSCNPLPPLSCPSPWGGAAIPHGTQITAFVSDSDATCDMKIRTCNNGNLDGVGTYASCVKTCLLDGVTTKSGLQTKYYLKNNPTFAEGCISQLRTCTNGVFTTGTYTYYSCTAQAPLSCPSPWGGAAIPHGTQITAYFLPNSAACNPEIRTCNNGNLDGVGTYASCLKTCTGPDGSIIFSGSSKTYYSSSSVLSPLTCAASSEVRTCTNGVLSGTFSKLSCIELKQCTLDGKTISSGSSYSFFSATSVPFGSNCAAISQSRLCTNGILDGTSGYQYQSCSSLPPASCPLPWGGTIVHGDSRTAYSIDSSATCGTFETRTCYNGLLSGSYQYASCAKTCVGPDGFIIKSGLSKTYYSSSSVSYPATCAAISEVRTCTNGVLSPGLFLNPSCSVKPHCTGPDGSSIDVGSGKKYYSSPFVSFGNNCVSQTRNCISGSFGIPTLLGSYNYASCSVNSPASCVSPFGGIIPHGNSVNAYSTNIAFPPESCPQPQIRTCNDGVLSCGSVSYNYPSCAVQTSNDKINVVINAINAIGTLTIGSIDPIHYVQNLYYSLPDDATRALVTNYETLQNAEYDYDMLLKSYKYSNTCVDTDNNNFNLAGYTAGFYLKQKYPGSCADSCGGVSKIDSSCDCGTIKTPGSCTGSCGGPSKTNPNCYCDSLCTTYGDCCSDYVYTCNTPLLPTCNDYDYTCVQPQEKEFIDYPLKDYCTGEFNLTEYACGANGLYTETNKVCDYGCINGACRSAPYVGPSYYYNWSLGKIYHFYLCGPGQTRTLYDGYYLYNFSLLDIQPNAAFGYVAQIKNGEVSKTVTKLKEYSINGLTVYIYDIQPSYIVLETREGLSPMSNVNYKCERVHRLSRYCGNHSILIGDPEQTGYYDNFTLTEPPNSVAYPYTDWFGYSMFKKHCVEDGSFNSYYEEWCTWVPK
jgi:hypothetical protein